MPIQYAACWNRALILVEGRGYSSTVVSVVSERGRTPSRFDREIVGAITVFKAWRNQMKWRIGISPYRGATASYSLKTFPGGRRIGARHSGDQPTMAGISHDPS